VPNTRKALILLKALIGVLPKWPKSAQ